MEAGSHCYKLPLKTTEEVIVSLAAAKKTIVAAAFWGLFGDDIF